MLLFRRWLVFLLAALAWAGCSTSNESGPAPMAHKPLPPTPIHMEPQTPIISTPVITNPPVIRARTNPVIVTNIASATNATIPSTAQSTNLPPPPHPATNAPVANTPRTVLRADMPEWVEMSRWSAVEGLRLTPQSPSIPRRYQLHSERGDLVFIDKNQTAYWNGQALMLSFAPQTEKGRPYLHRADLQHTIIPLLHKSLGSSHDGKIVVIDPGHGGNQPGSRTVVGNHLEKELTLDWALRIRALMTNQGWRVFLTRTNDVEVSLSNRVAVADNLHADLFVSLHFNSFSNPEYAGLETYCSTPAGMPSNLVRGSEDELALPNNAFDDENLCWAVRLHESLVRETHVADRGVRRERFMAVLRNQKRPAVLIEGGYLSNRKEATKLGTEAYRQQLAEAVVKALTKQ